MLLLRKIIKAITTPEFRNWLRSKEFDLFMFSRRMHTKRLHKRPVGINLFGHIHGDFGLGVSCRLVANAIKNSNVPLSVFNISAGYGANENDTTWNGCEEGKEYNINLIHINPNEIPPILWGLKRDLLDDNYNIAYWLWELEEFPKEWIYLIALFDEIWTPSEFITKTLKKYTQKPVYTMSYGLTVPETVEHCDRSFFGLPEDKTLFMLSYDGFSVSERKNPFATIRAFREAFLPTDNVGLVVKATHASKEDISRVQEYLKDYSVYILTDNYSKAQFNSLIKAVDVYVSLHRAEGFGLVMAEAMLLGTATIATNWSANTYFMNSDVACMVDAEIVELEKDYPPYHKGDHWAQADETQACEYMKKLYLDQDYRYEIENKAKNYISEVLSVEKAAYDIESRVKQLEENNFRA